MAERKSSKPVYRPSSPYIVLLFIAIILLQKYNLDQQINTNGIVAVEFRGDTSRSQLTVIKNKNKSWTKLWLQEVFSEPTVTID